MAVERRLESTQDTGYRYPDSKVSQVASSLQSEKNAHENRDGRFEDNPIVSSVPPEVARYHRLRSASKLLGKEETSE